MACVAMVVTYSGIGKPINDYDDATGAWVSVHGMLETLPGVALRMINHCERRSTGLDGEHLYCDLPSGRRVLLKRSLVEWIGLWWTEIDWRLTDESTTMSDEQDWPFWVGLKDGRVVAIAGPAVTREAPALPECDCTPGCYFACPKLVPPPAESGLRAADHHAMCWCDCHVTEDGQCVAHGFDPCPAREGAGQ